MQSVLLIIAVLLFALPVFASEEIPVNIKAGQLKYIEGTGIILATGSVEVKFEGVTILADTLYLDSESKIATAEGHVRMITADYRAVSERITYFATREASCFSGFDTTLYPGKMKGPLYLSARQLSDRGGPMQGEGGNVTTCGEETPHFFTVADRVEYYPEDKIIGYNATLYVGGMPALWMPVMFYDLSRRQERNWVFGHNQVEGDYLKTTWGYPYGILYLDLMEKKGFGYGTRTPYALAGLGLGTLFLYHVDEKDTGLSDWVTSVQHTKQINQFTTLKLDHGYSSTYLIPFGRRDQTTFNLDLGYQSEARWNLGMGSFDDRIAALQKYSLGFDQAYRLTSTSYHFNYDYSKKAPAWIRTSQRFQHRRPLWSDRVMLSTRANYYNNIADAGAVGDQRLEPAFDLTGRESGYSWRYSSNWYVDPDGDRYQGDNGYQYLEKLPEVEITPDPVSTALVVLRPRFGYGHYREVRYVSELGGNRDFASERYSVTLNADRSLPLFSGTTLSLGAGVDQHLYTPGDALYAYRESASLRTAAGGFFRNNLDYQKGLTDGNSPFLFDRLGTRYHNIREQMTFYYLSHLSWTTSGGHNWQTGKWFDIDTSLMMRPNQRLLWNLRGGWDIENTRYKDLVNSLTLSPYGFLNMVFSAVSDLNSGRLRSGSALYDVYFLQGEPNQLQVKVSQVYEPASEELKVRDIMVVKDLHCWELKYTYSDYRREFSLTISLKALPDEPVGLSTGRGFYFDSFEKELKGLKPEGAIQRY